MMLSYGSKKVDLNMLLINIFRLKFINTSLNYKINFKMLNWPSVENSAKNEFLTKQTTKS